MALPDRPVSSWFQGMDLPNSLFGTGGTDSELYEENDEFVLSVESESAPEPTGPRSGVSEPPVSRFPRARQCEAIRH